ncbi:MAG: hypothetical protein JWP00_3210 [Chloroflexi bacterium]|jgi:hypothetical protein|nr:hypothetical protein [Chloroflexota bacterium]
MSTTKVRYLALLVAFLGITLLIWRNVATGSGRGYDTVRLIHILGALALIGMFEMVIARSKRAKALNPDGTRLATAGRVLLTLALVVGIILLLSLVFDWVSGNTYDLVVYLHALLGLSAVGVVITVFTKRYTSSR